MAKTGIHFESAEQRPFHEHGKAAVHGVRRALAGLLEAVGADPSEPQEISRKFGLDKTLTWRITRVIREDDAWEAIAHIPRQPSIKLFVGAMSKHGAAASRIDAVWRALEEYERFIETHSGDRETLEVMASSTARKSAAKRLEAFRKSAFLGNSAIWGVRARVQFALRLIAPSAMPGMLDVVTVSGFVGFQRLRSDTPWAVANLNAWERQESTAEKYVRGIAPLDLRGERGGVPLLPDFCSVPLPEMRVIESPQRVFQYMLGPGPVGNTATANVLMGWVDRATGPYTESFPGERAEFGQNMFTPAEEMIHDVLVHKDMDYARDPKVRVYSQLPGSPQYPSSGPDAAVIQVPTELVELDRPMETLTPEVGRYVELVELGATSLGRTAGDFVGWRYRLRYPPIPAMAVISHGLMAGG